MKTSVFLLFLFTVNLQLLAQELPKENPKSRKQRLIEDPLTPSKAAFYSAILPGLGQIYIESLEGSSCICCDRRISIRLCL